MWINCFEIVKLYLFANNNLRKLEKNFFRIIKNDKKRRGGGKKPIREGKNEYKLPSERERNRTIFVGYSYYAIDIGKV